MSEPTARPLCTCKSSCMGCSSVHLASQQGIIERERPLLATCSACHTFQEVCAKGSSGNKALCDVTGAATPDTSWSETMHNASHTKLTRNIVLHKTKKDVQLNKMHPESSVGLKRLSCESLLNKLSSCQDCRHPMSSSATFTELASINTRPSTLKRCDSSSGAIRQLRIL